MKTRHRRRIGTGVRAGTGMRSETGMRRAVWLGGMAVVVVGAATGLGCGAGQSRSPSPSGVSEETSSIVGGETDTGDPSVVAVYAEQPGQAGGFLCTGSVIAPTVVLTAAHCVSESETGPGATFTVLTSPNINRNGGGALAVREVHANPLWSANRLAGGHDQGIVVLAQRTALAALPINRTPLPSSLRGQAVRIVGYGLNDADAQSGAGVKRQAMTNLGAIQANLIAVGDSRRGTCNGDSGGPAFMSLNGTETIVGTTSYGNADCSDGGYDARVDTDLAFIDGYVQGACAPTCAGRACGGDGCGGTCGACDPGQLCTEAGTCSVVTDACGAGGGIEQEPNESALQANPLCPGGVVSGGLSSSSDQDWFTFTTPADVVYEALLASTSASASLRVYKLAATTGRLSFIGDGPRVSRHTDAGGTYVARVTGGPTPAAGYTLTVTLTP